MPTTKDTYNGRIRIKLWWNQIPVTVIRIAVTAIKQSRGKWSLVRKVLFMLSAPVIGREIMIPLHRQGHSCQHYSITGRRLQAFRGRESGYKRKTFMKNQMYWGCAEGRLTLGDDGSCTYPLSSGAQRHACKRGLCIISSMLSSFALRLLQRHRHLYNPIRFLGKRSICHRFQ